MVKLVKNDENNGELWMNNGQLVSLLVKKIRNYELEAMAHWPMDTHDDVPFKHGEKTSGDVTNNQRLMFFYYLNVCVQDGAPVR